jgi:outer membrane immunogenic protein
MKKLLAITASILAVSAVSASAADMAAAPRPYTKAPPMVAVAYDWSGFYIGLNGGAGWGRVATTDTVFGTTTRHDPNGGLAGGQIGYNWQANAWVFGLEADGDWANIRGSAPCPAAAFFCASNTSALASFRGRVGYAAGPVLFYGTGGAGYAQTNFFEGPPIAGIVGSFTSDRWGYTAGAGIEWGFAPNWSAKVEYLHYGFDSVTANPPTLALNPVSTSVRIDTVKVGVNYHFSPAVIAKY